MRREISVFDLSKTVVPFAILQSDICAAICVASGHDLGRAISASKCLGASAPAVLHMSNNFLLSFLLFVGGPYLYSVAKCGTASHPSSAPKTGHYNLSPPACASIQKVAYGIAARPGFSGDVRLSFVRSPRCHPSRRRVAAATRRSRRTP